MALCKECGLEWTPMHHSEDEYTGEEYGCPFAKMNHGTPKPHPVRVVEDNSYQLSVRGFTVADGPTCLCCEVKKPYHKNWCLLNKR